MTMLDKTGEGRTAETMTIRAYKRIRMDILTGELAPNRKLKIDDLKRLSGFGASPLREALALLVSDGLTVRIDARGFRVAPVSLKDYEDLHRMRCHLEGMALRTSMQNGDKDWEERVVLAHYWLDREARKEQGTHPSAGDAGWEVGHKAFHMALLSACDSDILRKICSQLFDKNIRYRNMSRAVTGKKRAFSQEHAQIFEAVSAKNEDLAVERLLAHYSRTADLVRAFLSDAAHADLLADQTQT